MKRTCGRRARRRHQQTRRAPEPKLSGPAILLAELLPEPLRDCARHLLAGGEVTRDEQAEDWRWNAAAEALGKGGAFQRDSDIRRLAVPEAMRDCVRREAGLPTSEDRRHKRNLALALRRQR